MSEDNLAKITQQYILLRDKRKADTKAFKEADGKVKDMMEQLEGHALAILHARKEDSAKTEFGTPYISTVSRYSVDKSDGNSREDLEKYILESGNVGLMGNSLNKEAVALYQEKNDGALPPGVKTFDVITVNFRAPAK